MSTKKIILLSVIGIALVGVMGWYFLVYKKSAAGMVKTAGGSAEEKALLSQMNSLFDQYIPNGVPPWIATAVTDNITKDLPDYYRINGMVTPGGALLQAYDGGYFMWGYEYKDGRHEKGTNNGDEYQLHEKLHALWNSYKSQQIIKNAA